MIRTLLLPNGLKVTLIHQPEATEAAALVQVAAGSHDEPERWPGLAHLLEHLLFTGSERWPDEGRLMRWIQASGGRVNATTLARRSAWFFETASDQLSDGVARLQDMLCAPLLTLSAIKQEVAVIDAEYQMLRCHAPARAEAALCSLIAEPGFFQRFTIGSAAAFGDNTGALQTALRDFHRRFFVAKNMQLWLQGPQSLEALEQIARDFAGALPEGDMYSSAPALRFSAAHAVKMHALGDSTLWLSWLLPADLSDSVTLLREFLLDEAEGSLMATLRQRGIASNLTLKWLYQADNSCLLAAVFTTDAPDAVTALVRQTLQALLLTTSAQQQHYLQLAQQQFATLSPLAQLQQRVLGFAPAEPVWFARLITAVLNAPLARLFCSPEVQGETVVTQGFELSLATWPTSSEMRVEPASLHFYPRNRPFAPSVLPDQAITLPQVKPDDAAATLTLRPEFFTNLCAETALAYGERLRPLFATVRHLGGHGDWHEVQGVWQLTLRLPDDWLAADWALTQILRVFSQQAESVAEEAPDTIAIRQLLRVLPRQLTAVFQPACWRAVLSGGSKKQHQLVACHLSLFSVPVNPAQRFTPPAPRSGLTRVDHASRDRALLLFIPLKNAPQLAALRALALVYEPRFFQRLRVEQQIGYVVSSRYLRCADRDGVLFALQSPALSVTALLRHCKMFLRALTEAMPTLDMASLKSHLRTVNSDPALALLRRENGLPEPEPAAIDALTWEDLQQLHQQLLRERRAWRVLFSDGRAA